jgi:tRNA threonylcarbamoyladenosine biosynthesis protein TsaE
MEWIISLRELPSFAREFWLSAGDTLVFAFHGQMGAGKTTIIEALCREKGVTDTMGSPTFSIINEYVCTDDKGQKSIYHIDLYRLKDEQEVVQAGVEDCVYSGSICFVEWPEKAPGLFDDSTAHIFIDVLSENQRKLNLRFGSSMQ